MLAQTRRHEYNSPSSSLSHWAKYRDALGAPSNPGDVLEKRVGGPGQDQTTFNQQTQSLLATFGRGLATAVAVEPVAENLDDAGNFDGQVCYTPYTDPTTCNR